MAIADRAKNVNSYVSGGTEESWGATSPADFYVPLTAQNLNHNRPIIKSSAALGIRYTSQYIQGIIDPSVGGFSAEIWQDEFAPWVYWALGSDTVSGASSPFTHQIERAASIPSITLRKGIDVDEHVYEGYKINELTINVGGSGEIPSFDVTGFSRGEQIEETAASPSFTTENAYAGHNVTVYLAAEGTARGSFTNEYFAQGLSLSINNNIEAPSVPLGSSEIREEPVAGELMITGSLDFETFDESANNSAALYDDFKAGTARALLIRFSGANSFNFDIYQPRIVFNGASPNASGKTGPVGITLNYDTFYNTAQATELQFFFEDTRSVVYS
jgi:hypothetical protein